MNYSLTNPQNSIWLTEKFFKGTSVNNICGYIHIKDEVNFDVLKKAINELVKTNDSMRFKFTEEKNTCIQSINEFKKFDIEMFNFSIESDIENKALEMANIPFDIDKDLLFKFILFKLPNNSGGFIVNVHHIISDSWTLGLIAKEVTGIYSEILNSTYEEKQFPSYTNYINNEIEYINSEKYIKDKEYWDEVFTTVPEVASIPSMKNNKNVSHSCNGAREKFIIPNKEIEKIKEFCTNHKISVYNFFMGIYSIYLGRVSNLDDFVIGTPILNRINFEQKHTMGMFISTAPLRICLDNSSSFIDFTKQIASNSMSLLRHQRYPYQAILEDLRKKDSNIPNLYNIVLSYQITKTVEEENNISYTTDWVFNGNCADELQIHLFDLHGEDSITVAYDYKSEKYDSEDINNLHDRVLNIINQVIDNNEILLKNIEIVTSEEKHKILYEFNNAKVDYTHTKTIVDLFEEQAQKTPDNIAVVFEDQKLTYRELNEKANYIANQIINKKLFNKYISIICDKSLEMIIGIIAILKSGNAYVPIDPKSPDSRINFIINSIDSSLLLTTSKYEEKYSNYDIINISLENSLKNNVNKSCPENSAYIIFTSGSTGTPKGVEILNKNIVNTLMWRKIFYNFNTSTCTLQLPSFAFDSSVEDIFTSLISGSCLVIPTKQINDIDSLINDVIKNNISHFLITPALYNILLDNDNCSSINSLKFITIAGESFGIDLIKKHYSVFPEVELINEYGPTENSVCSTVYKFSKNSDSISIGQPILGSMAYVVSISNTLCPIGIPGELWVSGNGVAKGYFKNENLTNEKFIQNPFGNGLVYKTGDLVKWSPNGNIEFIGRIDNQVKLRGYRIELSEIDSNILTYPNIKQSISDIKEINNNKVICSYIVCEKNININELKSYLSKTLANFMMPTYIIQLDNLPLNINGKVDRKQLPLPSVNEIKKEIIPARNKTDKVILSILENILGLTNISIEDNLFDIGMDSLYAITISSNISKELHIQISVKDIFEYPIIKKLSDYISTLSGAQNTNGIQKSEKMPYYPLSSAQKRIYYTSSMDTNSILYNISGGIILNKTLDINKLEKCFNLLINRHEILRTCFEIKDNNVVQIIKDSIDFKLNVDNSTSENINDLYSSFVKPFDLSKAPLFRAKVFTLENNKMLLLLDMHHIISDGASLGIILKDLCDLYNDNELTEKQIDYKDFTVWEKEQFNADNFKNSKEYWLNQFNDEIPLLNMPLTYSRPSIQSFEGANYYTKLSKLSFERIENTSKILGVTPYMLMLSCYYILLSKYTSQEDIVVGTPIVGRELPELSNMLGMFVNTLALRNKIDGKLSFRDFLATIKSNCLSAFKHQNYPFDELVKDLNIKREISRNPLFDVMFIYQNNGYPEIKFKETKAEYFIPNNNISKFDLSLEVIPVNNEYSIHFEYCTKLFDETFIKRFSSHYLNILNSILENSDIKISDIDMISAEEKNQILYDFNNTTVDYPKDKTIIDLFEEQVEKTPDNIAVVFEEQKLTYKELNEKANSLARYLIQKGVNNNSIIGIMLPRSLEIMVGILGVLKTGACYIPIDPSFPKERIEYMLENSNSIMLLKNNNIKNISFDNVIDIDLTNLSIYQLENTNINKIINPENLSYVIYTSGSTGKPKGVALRHKSLYNLACYLNNTVAYFKDVYSNLSIASITTISFDIFLFETLISLQRGLKVVIANESEQTNPSLLDSLIEKHNIKAIQMTPSRMQVFINNKNYMPHLSNLEYITLAGEALPTSLKNELLELGNITIYNGYGPSETTVFSTFTNATHQENITIGKPISNTYMYVLDKNMHLCPIGIPGELYISGDGVGIGYLNNTDLTNKSFISDPFNPNLVMYKTGDLVKYLPNNELHYIGRADNQVKIRGLRIELDEIQKWISKYKDINKVVLSSHKDNTGRQYIVAYLTVTNRVSINNLKIFLGNHIPKYMIPTYFIILNDFPYLPNGKINKKALPFPNNSLYNAKKYIAPINRLEIDITQIFEKLLSISPISTEDNFFDIGGDSLLAMSLQLELLKLNINVTYSDIFMYPSVKELANHILSNSKKTFEKISTEEFYKYDEILNNTINIPSNLNFTSTGNVLLAGVTGFLGIHILSTFLENETGNIYCLIRQEPGLTIEQKLLNKLHYYFGDKYDALIGTRIIPIKSDISNSNMDLTEEAFSNLASKVDLVINSAAKVSHYGNYGDYKKINVDGTQNLINFCMKNNKRFYQISTLSVSGNSLTDDSCINQEIYFNENNFYINQALDNVYVRSKFEAEKIVLDNILNGLDGYIIRVGNLMNRFLDGKFQSNVSENAYITRLLTYHKIGYVPDYLADSHLELTPVDSCAQAILKIVQYNSKTNRIFHVLNHKNITLLNFITILNKFYDKIEIINNDKFIKHINNYLNNPNLSKNLSGLLNDFNENKEIIYTSNIKVKSDFTIKYLNMTNFEWPEINEDYIIKFLKFYDNLNLLNRKDEN